MNAQPLDFHRRRRVDANIDMVPIIDTLFQLFLLFLLSASFVSSTVELQLPHAGTVAAATATQTVVSLDAERRLYVDGDPLSLEALTARLQDKLQGSPELKVALRADRSVPYQDLLDTIVAIQRAGVRALQLEHEPGPTHPAS